MDFLPGLILYVNSIIPIKKIIQFPHSVGMLVFGLLLGLIAPFSPLLMEFLSLSKADPHLILALFLPPLILESAFTVDFYTFKCKLGQSFILASFGLVIASALTGVVGLYMLPYDWHWQLAMLFGVIVSPTDPVAVVAILNDLGKI